MSRTLMTLVLVALLAPAGAHRDPSGSTIPSATGQAQFQPETQAKLRKLHLVRPDLIPYPIAYAVYC